MFRESSEAILLPFVFCKSLIFIDLATRQTFLKADHPNLPTAIDLYAAITQTVDRKSVQRKVVSWRIRVWQTHR
jgi:hypothetical protein